MKTRFINKIHLEEKYLPYKWMEKLVSNGKLGGVMLVFVEGFSESEINTKVKKIKEFCSLLKEGGEENMDDTDTQEMTHQEKVHDIRKRIDAVINYVYTVKGDTREEYSKGKREWALVYTKLQEAKMWAGKVLEELGSELPEQYQDKAK